MKLSQEQREKLAEREEKSIMLEELILDMSKRELSRIEMSSFMESRIEEEEELMKSVRIPEIEDEPDADSDY